MEVTGGDIWPNNIGPERDGKICASHQASVYTCSPEGGVVWNLPYSHILLKNPKLVSFKPCSTI